MKRFLLIALSLSTQLSYALECLPYQNNSGKGTLCTGHSVVLDCKKPYYPGEICYGEVKRIDSAEKIKVKTHRGSVVVSINKISQLVEALPGIVPGNQVILKDENTAGEILFVYADRTVEVKFGDNPNYPFVSGYRNGYQYFRKGSYEVARVTSDEEQKNLFLSNNDVVQIVATSKNLALVSGENGIGSPFLRTVAKNALKSTVSCLSQRPEICSGKSIKLKTGETVLISKIFVGDVIYIVSTYRDGSPRAEIITVKDL